VDKTVNNVMLQLWETSLSAAGEIYVGLVALATGGVFDDRPPLGPELEAGGLNPTRSS
jgi:hypothetical protein